MASLTENTKRIADALDDIKTSIIAKGQTPSGKCETYASAIDNIETGTDVSDTTAIESDVVKGKSFYKADGIKTQGTIKDNIGRKYIPITPQAYDPMFEAPYMTVSEKMCIDENTHLTLGEVGLGNATKGDVRKGKTFSNGTGFGLVGELETTDTSDTTATSQDVLSGKRFHGADGSIVYGSCYDNNGTDMRPIIDGIDSDNNVLGRIIFPDGYGRIMIDTNTTIKSDVSSLLQNKTVTLTDSEQTITADSGKILGSVIVPAGSGGNRVKTGTFTSSTNVQTIDCGFTPSIVMAFSGYGTSGFPMAAYYNVEGSQKYVGARSTSIGAGSSTVSLLEIVNNGFTHRAPNNYYANLDSFYIAVE